MELLSECPVCNGNRHLLFLNIPDYSVSGERFSIVQCKGCGFKFTNPRPVLSEAGRYYESDDYISHSNINKGFINRMYQFIRRFAISQKVKMIKEQMKHVPGNEIRILDVGCGTGEFLNACKKEGWKVFGVEPSVRARDYAKDKYGLQAEDPSLLEKLPPASFNCITLWHVLEHIYPLGDTLASLRRLPAKGGVLIAALPNCQSLDAKIYKEHWAAYDVPRHLYHFSPDTATRLFTKHEFEVKQILPMYFDAFYICMLSEKYRNGNFFSGILNGLRSDLSAMMKGRTFSSHIYISG